MSLITFNAFQHTSKIETADGENASVTDTEKPEKGPRARKGETGNTLRKAREPER